jgi:hypothetical protein
MSNKQLADFPANMIAGCEAALDADVFYQDEFRDFVVKHMGGFGCEPVLVDSIEYDCDAAEYFKRLATEGKALAERIKASPRGHYAVIARKFADGRKSYSAIMSNGQGEIATGGSHDGYSEVPPSEKIRLRMVGYEIYECRNAVEAKRKREADIAALEKHDLKVGMEFKDYRHPSETKRYSKAVIEAVYPETGRLKLLLTRRGSPKRWNAEIGAKWFVEEVGLQVHEPEKPPFIVVKTLGQDALFI